jgi:hypothetical protein
MISSEVQKMKAGQLYLKTMPFVWAKLLLGLVTVFISVVLLAILMGIAWLFKSVGVGCILFLLWLVAVNIVRFVIMHYIGYLIKAGHIAVMAEAVTTGRVPSNQVSYGKNAVKERFATSNVYFVIDKLVKVAVKQIQRGIGRAGNMFGFVPGMKQITGLAQFFVELSLGYVDECCLGYTFYKKEQGAFKSAADGVVIYAQNWKILLGDAAKTMVMVILGVAAITVALVIFFGILVWLLPLPGLGGAGKEVWGLIAFGLALLLAITVKWAFMDSFVLARTMVSYMGVAPTTTITFDLYEKLCKLSAKFKELFNKGQKEGNAQNEGSAPQANNAGELGHPQTPPAPAPVPSAPPTQPQAAAPVQTAPVQTNAAEEKPAFCGECGAKIKRGAKFCGECGAKQG